MRGFHIAGLDPAPFRPLFQLSANALAGRGIMRSTADNKPGFPCRITLADAEPGETLLLLNFEHQPARTPFRASHAIFVRESATQAAIYDDAIPPALAERTISLRAFDEAGMMHDASLCDGRALAALIERMFSDDRTAYLHAHYAKQGCFAARIDRR